MQAISDHQLVNLGDLTLEPRHIPRPAMVNERAARDPPSELEIFREFFSPDLIMTYVVPVVNRELEQRRRSVSAAHARRYKDITAEDFLRFFCRDLLLQLIRTSTGKEKGSELERLQEALMSSSRCETLSPCLDFPLHALNALAVWNTFSHSHPLSVWK